MNYAYLHIVLTHIPVVAFPVLTSLLIVSMVYKNKSMKKIVLIFMMLMGSIAVPVYLTGEPAFNAIDNYPGVRENVVEPHQEMGEKALVVLVIEILVILSILIFEIKSLEFVNVALAVFASMALIYTAYLGGKIRHTEARVPIFRQLNN